MKMTEIMKACFWALSVIFLSALGPEEEAVGQHAWTGTDVGKVGTAGSYSEKDGVFTLNGAGGGVYIAGDVMPHLRGYA